jgi:hypothetical protein
MQRDVDPELPAERVEVAAADSVIWASEASRLVEADVDGEVGEGRPRL